MYCQKIYFYFTLILTILHPLFFLFKKDRENGKMHHNVCVYIQIYIQIQMKGNRKEEDDDAMHE